LESFEPRNVFAAIPVKSRAESKSRLSVILNPQERVRLTQTMFKDVMGTVSKSGLFKDVFVISSDLKILELAGELGANTVQEAERGLNRAVEQVTEHCMEKGTQSILTLPSDIPLMNITDLNRILELGSEWRSIVVSPSRYGGTNALLCTPPDAIPPCFGQNSFMKHVEAARKRGVNARAYWSPSMALDLDSAFDLRRFLRESHETMTHMLLLELNIYDRLREIMRTSGG
jgi:2-phospho-L-lactate guanylyltransferase